MKKMQLWILEYSFSSLSKLLFTQYKYHESVWFSQSLGRLLSWQLFRWYSLPYLLWRSLLKVWLLTTVSKHLHGKEKCGRKRCTSMYYEDCQAKPIQELGMESLRMSALRLESVCQEPPCTDISNDWDTSVAFIVSSHIRMRENVKSILPILRRRN